MTQSRFGNEPRHNAPETMNQVVDQVGGAIKDAASQAYAATTKKADEVAANLGGTIRQWGDRLQANSTEGVLAGASQAMADHVKRGGEYLEHAKFSGAKDDVADLIKRYPLQAVLIAAGLGWFFARRL